MVRWYAQRNQNILHTTKEIEVFTFLNRYYAQNLMHMSTDDQLFRNKHNICSNKPSYPR